MKKHFTFCLAAVLLLTTYAQNLKKQKMVAMSDTYQKAYKLGSKYYQNGTNKPFTGVLYGKYDNGQYMTMQEFVDGIGNGKWIDFDPYGRKVCEGTYKNNRIEGPVTFYYESGKVKSKGQYLHWKRPIGKWTYYDENGNVVSTLTFTR